MPVRLGVVASEIHRDIAEEMLALAQAKVVELGIDLVKVLRVPGSLEAPLAVSTLLARDDIDCVAVVGYIERGETLHGEQIGLVVTLRLKELEECYRKPVGVGIVGPGATMEQAQARLHYGADAVAAAVTMCSTLST